MKIDLIDITDLIETLRKWDDAYFNGESIVSDEAYDRLKKEAESLDPSNPYFKEVGHAVRGAAGRNTKVKLPYPMGSLNQRYADDIAQWIAAYGLHDKNIVLTHKLDGVSCLLVYRNNKLYRAYSRGDGYEGQDITKHVSLLSSVPLELKSDVVIEELAVRAELIMKREVFDSNHSTVFKNPRNLVAGIFNRKESDTSILRDIDLVAYEIVNSTIALVTSYTKHDMMHLLNDYGFAVVSGSVYRGNLLNGDVLEQAIIDAKATSPYELDGVVLTVECWGDLEEQSKAQSLNPEHSVKYKITDQSSIKTTKVVKVHWEISKSGFFKPRVEIIPVDIGGVTITYATGFNGKFIFDNKIGPDAEVRITRSGDVIPYIIEVTQGTSPDFPPDGEWEWNENAKGERVELLVVDKNNTQVVFKQVLDFFTSLDVELLKEASLRELFKVFDLEGDSYTSIIGTILDLTEIEFEKAIGANGRKIFASLHRRLQNLTMPILMGSLNYCGIGFGVRKAKTLLEQVSFDELKGMSVDEVAQLNGFDVTTATLIVKGIPEITKFIETFSDYLEFKVEEKKTDLAGLNVVMTGFRDKDLQQKIEGLGGKVASAVSGKTTHLLAVDINSGSGKLTKAKQAGITIMTPDQFKDTFNL